MTIHIGETMPIGDAIFMFVTGCSVGIVIGATMMRNATIKMINRIWGGK